MAAGSAPRSPLRQKSARSSAGAQRTDRARPEGRPLPADVKHSMQRLFDWDFGEVRIHADQAAAAAARSVRAGAFTVGRDIAFAPGRYAPETPEGKRLLAHELAHVVQQARGGPTPPSGGDPSLENAADDAAASIMTGAPAAVAGSSGIGMARDDDDHKWLFPPVPRLTLPPYTPQPPSLRLDPLRPPSLLPPVPDVTLTPPAPVHDRSYLKFKPAPDVKPDQSPDDPQTVTPTGGLILGNAQTQDKGDFGLNWGLSRSTLPGGFAPGFGFAAGVATLPHHWGFELGATGAVPGGNSTAVSVLPHFAYAPDDAHFNFGVFGNVGDIGGASPPGRSDLNPQAGATAIFERPVGEDRDKPWFLPSLHLNAGYSRYSPVGSGFASNAFTGGPALNLQFNPGYYTASDGTTSKTPKDTIFGEGAFNYTHGSLFGGPGTATATSEAVNAGYFHNFRLNDGHLIVSPGVWAGFKHEDDQLPGTHSSQWSGAAGLTLGVSLSPSSKTKKPDDPPN